MEFAFRIKLSTYKRLIKNGHTFEHSDALQYRDAVQRSIKAAFAMKRAARLRRE